MALEKPAYRDNLELVLDFMRKKYGGDRMMMRNKDIQEFTGLNYHYVRNNYMQGETFISVAVFARMIS